MSDFKTRLKEEQLQLEIKVRTLGDFTLSTSFDKIDSTQQVLLKAQHSAMKTYLIILEERMKLLGIQI